MRNWLWFERRVQDIRHGTRRLSRSPGLTATAVLTLSLGFGASATIFSIVNGVLLRSLPIREPDRVITFWLSAPKTGLPEAQLSDALFASLRQRARSLESFAAYEPEAFVLTDRGDPEVVDGVAVTVDYFRVLGIRPLHGRAFLPEEDSPGSNHGFVVLQFALSFVLLVGTGLLVQSLRNLLAVDPGFRAANVISGSVWLPPAKYPSRLDVQRFYEDFSTASGGRRACALPA
jgi:MacB-like periplasmic core domain